MKIVRFTAGDEPVIRFGVWSEEGVRAAQGDMFADWTYTGELLEHDAVRLQAPVAPRHILGIGKNFAAAGATLPAPPDLPIWFIKPTSTVVGPEAAIELPAPRYEAKFESELAVVIGREGRDISEADALSYVFGYTVANDLAEGGYFHEEGHWTVGKSFDTFCPLGPHIETELDLEQVRIRAYLNGELVQDAGLELMITSIRRQIAHLSSFMTLAPGDVILTGTPAGAALLKDGDVIECEVSGIGRLRNHSVNKR